MNFSKPRTWVTWNWVSATLPSSSSWIVILAWPSMRLTGSIVMRFIASSYPNLTLRGLGLAAFQQVVQALRAMTLAGGGQPGNVDVDLDEVLHRPRLLQQARQTVVGDQRLS